MRAPLPLKSHPVPPPPPRVSVIVVTYNSIQDLEHCLPALKRQTTPAEVVVVDSDSPDGTADWVATHHPDLRLIRAGANLGYAGGNNLGFSLTDSPLLAVLNPDTEPTPTWLEELIQAQERNPAAGLLTSSIRLHHRPDHINACGNELHVTGIAFCRGLNEPAAAHAVQRPVAAVSGAAFLARRAVLEELHGFDPEFFTYLEDTDLSIRCRLAGHEVLYVPQSVVLHRYVNHQTPRKLYYLERNRLLLLFKDLRPATLALMAPVLLLGEVQAWTYALLRGLPYLRAKAHSYRWVWSRRRHISERSRLVIRARSDSSVLRLMTPRLAIDQVQGDGRGARLLSALVEAVYQFLFLPARHLIR